MNCRCVGIGRRDGLKIRCGQPRVGSTPTIGTKLEQSYLCSGFFVFINICSVITVSCAMFEKASLERVFPA